MGLLGLQTGLHDVTAALKTPKMVQVVIFVVMESDEFFVSDHLLAVRAGLLLLLEVAVRAEVVEPECVELVIPEFDLAAGFAADQAGLVVGLVVDSEVVVVVRNRFFARYTELEVLDLDRVSVRFSGRVACVWVARAR